MRKSHIIVLAILITFALSGAAAQAYNGILYTSDGGLIGTGDWSEESSLEWWVTQNPDSTWHYAYELIVPHKDVSHVIIEVSDLFCWDDLLNVQFGDGCGYETTEIDLFVPGPGNPNMPDSINGLKFDSTWGTTMTFSFDSTRMPVWGDFYAKDGETDGTVVTLWNAGFTYPDWDPTDAPSDGSIANHVLRPDTVVPEPSSLLAFAGGLAMLGNVLRRRRSK